MIVIIAIMITVIIIIIIIIITIMTTQSTTWIRLYRSFRRPRREKVRNGRRWSSQLSKDWRGGQVDQLRATNADAADTASFHMLSYIYNIYVCMYVNGREQKVTAVSSFQYTTTSTQHSMWGEVNIYSELWHPSLWTVHNYEDDDDDDCYQWIYMTCNTTATHNTWTLLCSEITSISN